MAGFIGGQGGINNAFMIVRLKPLSERKISAQKVIERIRKNQPTVPGGRMFLMADQDLQFGGGRQSSSAYAYTLLASDLNDLRTWVPRVTRALSELPELTSIDANDGEGAQQISLKIDRDAAKRLGIDMSTVTTLLNNAFSQRQISTIYESLNQYQVVMEIDPSYAQYPEVLEQIHVVTGDGRRVPLAAFAHYERSLEEDRVSHDGQFAAENIDFDLAPASASTRRRWPSNAR